MNPPADTTFVPPTASQLRSYIEDHPPLQAPPVRPWMFALGLAGLILLAASLESAWSWLLPWIAVFIAIGWMSRRVQRLRWLEAQVSRVQEMTLMRHWPQSMRLAWKLLPDTQRLPMLHGRLVAFMAHTLDAVRAYDASLVAYDYLLGRLPESHPTALPLRIHRVTALLADDRLADADDALRRLRGTVSDLPPGPVTAGYHGALLLQAIKTFHWDDACAMLDDQFVRRIRPLGIEAGYVYALAALALWQRDLIQRSPGAPASSNPAASAWFRRATLLIPQVALVHRFPELQPMLASMRPPSDDREAPAHPGAMDDPHEGEEFRE